MSNPCAHESWNTYECVEWMCCWQSCIRLKQYCEFDSYCKLVLIYTSLVLMILFIHEHESFMLASECTTTLICINMEYTTTLTWWCIYSINNVVIHSIILVVVHFDHSLECGGAHRITDGMNDGVNAFIHLCGHRMNAWMNAFIQLFHSIIYMATTLMISYMQHHTT